MVLKISYISDVVRVDGCVLRPVKRMTKLTRTQEAFLGTLSNQARKAPAQQSLFAVAMPLYHFKHYIQQ